MSRMLNQSAALSFAALLALALWAPTVAPVAVDTTAVGNPILA